MTSRKQVLANECYYHVFSRSISKYVVFNDSDEYQRIFKLIDLYRYDNFCYRMSDFVDIDPQHQAAIISNLIKENDLLVSIVAYCIMPTHIHLLLKQTKNKGIEKFMGKVLNAFSRYFNEKHHRSGPLWTGRFKNVLVNTDEQLLHLSRYMHLNPVSAGLINRPEEWQYSSYSEYTEANPTTNLCDYMSIIEMDAKQYKKFVNDGKDYQKSLAIIKNTLIDDYTG